MRNPISAVGAQCAVILVLGFSAASCASSADASTGNDRTSDTVGSPRLAAERVATSSGAAAPGAAAPAAAVPRGPGPRPAPVAPPPTQIDDDQLAQQVSAVVQQRFGAPPDRVSCPHLATVVGASVRCEATSGGTQHGVVVTVRKSRDFKIDFDIRIEK